MNRVHLAQILGRFFGKALVDHSPAIVWALDEIEADHGLCPTCGACPRCDGRCDHQPDGAGRLCP